MHQGASQASALGSMTHITPRSEPMMPRFGRSGPARGQSGGTAPLPRPKTSALGEDHEHSGSGHAARYRTVTRAPHGAIALNVQLHTKRAPAFHSSNTSDPHLVTHSRSLCAD